ncbi:hypothetical protein A9K55_002997 [Cordyceps militaris]|uniref:Uncharacterized protein n=1 Tax=Cordyceps militaris TaxID=73501 RepID=A0A2H4S5V3_CORMI|nr:hypothetical protein A9K55_002997 [Cordyceps militaris]
MDRLSQELIDRIAALLPAGPVPMADPPAADTGGGSASGKKASIVKQLFSHVRPRRDDPKTRPLPRYWTRASAAVLCYRWQRAVEPLVYAHLVLGYPGLGRLRAALARRPERRAYLRSLTVVLALAHEHWTDGGVRLDALQPLFAALSGEAVAAVDLTLRFAAGHPDLRHRTRQGIVFDRVHGAPLDLAACVRTLDFTPATPATERGRRDVLQLHLAEQASLVRRFPGLQSVVWHYAESELQEVRDRSRDGFADALAEQLSQRRQIANVGLTLRIGGLGTGISAASSVGRDSYEGLYAKLRAATAHVTELSYAGVVGPSLFLDPAAAGGDGWHALRHLAVRMALLTPAGQFYFDGHPYSPLALDTPPDWRPAYATLQPEQHDGIAPDGRPFLFCERPAEDVMGPLLRAWAGLLARLPALQTASLVARRGADEAPPWAVWYGTPGRTSPWVDGSGMDGDRPRVWFVTGRWRPGEDLVREFRMAGRGAGYGDNVSVIYWSILDPPVRI